jgi:hypothetical protein
VKADGSGQLRGLSSRQLSAERMENIRLRSELARVTMEATYWEKPRRTSRRCSDEYAWIEKEQVALAGMHTGPRFESERFGISLASGGGN